MRPLCHKQQVTSTITARDKACTHTSTTAWITNPSTTLHSAMRLLADLCCIGNKLLTSDLSRHMHPHHMLLRDLRRILKQEKLLASYTLLSFRMCQCKEAESSRQEGRETQQQHSCGQELRVTHGHAVSSCHPAVALPRESLKSAETPSCYTSQPGEQPGNSLYLGIVLGEKRFTTFIWGPFVMVRPFHYG